MALKNGEVIEELKKRGQQIGTGKYDQIKQYDDNLNNMLSSKRDEFQKPIAAFVTFNNHESVERCQKRFMPKNA